MMASAAAAPSSIPADVVPLTDAHRAGVLATAPVLAEHGVAITKRMYEVGPEVGVAEQH